jgi:glycosyltransferase involved in cell wall biosynthesis
MKLLYITNQICGPGGLERVLSIKTAYLVDKHDYKIHILTLNQGKKELFYTFSKHIVYHDILVKGNPIHYLRTYRKGIKDVIKKVSPDIVLVCDDGLKGLFLPLLIKKPCPMVYERHVSKNISIKNKKIVINKIKKWILFKIMDFGAQFYDKFIVLTKGNTKEWHLKNMEVIPNPLSFYPIQQSDLKNKKVLTVGKQSYQKGYDRLLKSWKLVHEKNPDWELDIYGTKDNSEKLEELAKNLGISNTVNFYDPIKNIAEKYQEASIYVMSSRYEGFGMVLTEAMAYGVPCVSFDCPYGPSDIIKHNRNGLLVNNNNIEELADSIIYLIENENIRVEMGKNARNDVKSYLPEKIVADWNTLFINLKTN